MSHSLRDQKGMTALGLLFVLGLIAFFVLLVLRLAPIYLEAMNVRGSLDSLTEEPFITKKTKREIKLLLTKRFRVNDIASVTSEDVVIEKSKGKLHVTVAYEVRKNMVGNVDVVVAFDEDVEIITH
jgi:hypothetical protein